MKAATRDRLNLGLLGFVVLLGVFLAVNRIAVVLSNQAVGFIDQRYLGVKGSVLSHAALGLIYVLPVPVLFSKRIRARNLELHRWLGRVSLIAGAALGINALLLQIQLQHGILAVHGYVFALLFLFSIGAAYRSIRRGDVVTHQVWTMRAFANAIGVSVGVRIMTVLCFVVFRVSNKIPMESLTVAEVRLISAIMFLSAWLGTLVPVLIAEILVARLPGRKNRKVQRERGTPTLSDTQPALSGSL